MSSVNAKPGDRVPHDLRRKIESIERHRRSAAAAELPKAKAVHAREINRILLELRESGVSGAELGRLLGVSREAARLRLESARALRTQEHGAEPPSSTHPEAELITPGDAATELGVSYNSLRRLAVRGHLEYIKTPGGHTRYCHACVTAWSNSH